MDIDFDGKLFFSGFAYIVFYQCEQQYFNPFITYKIILTTMYGNCCQNQFGYVEMVVFVSNMQIDRL